MCLHFLNHMYTFYISVSCFSQIRIKSLLSIKTTARRTTSVLQKIFDLTKTQHPPQPGDMLSDTGGILRARHCLTHTCARAHTHSYRHTCTLSLFLTHTLCLPRSLRYTLAVSHKHRLSVAHSLSLSLSLALSAMILRRLVLLSTRQTLIYPKNITTSNFTKSTHTGKLLGQACSHLYSRIQAHKLQPFRPTIFNIKGHILAPVVLHPPHLIM